MIGITRRGGLVLAGSVLSAPWVRAQGVWNPARPITIIVGFPPGGQTDFAARLVLSGMQNALGVAVTIDHRAGANGNLGTEAVMSARPDGYTILAGNSTSLVINPHTTEGMTIDPREMAPIGLVLRSPLILCAHPSLHLRDLAGLRSWIAAQPQNSIPYGSGITGSLSHVAMELLRDRLGQPKMTQVAYRSSAPALADLVAGRFSLMFDSASVVSPFLRTHQLRGVLTTGQARIPAFPDIGTAEEQGLRDFVVHAWIGLFAPRGTPPEIIARLNAALNAALADPAALERLAGRGDEPGGATPEAMGRILMADYARWGDVVRANNIRAEA